MPAPGTPLDDVSPAAEYKQMTQSELAARRQALFPGATPPKLAKAQALVRGHLIRQQHRKQKEFMRTVDERRGVFPPPPTPIVAVSPLMGGSGGSYQGSVAASPIQEEFRQPDFNLDDFGWEDIPVGVVQQQPPPLVMGPPGVNNGPV